MRSMTRFAAACLIAGFAPFVPRMEPQPVQEDFPGWPTTIDGRALERIPLQDYERRFAAALPGELAKFSDGTREYMLQWVASNTRLLHPATDCLANVGFKITPQPIWVDKAGNRWSCSLAARGDQAVRVRERISNDAGREWQDVSAWYWAALSGSSGGPWWVITVIEPVEATTARP